MRDRMKRRKKKSDQQASGADAASQPPPLQPKYPEPEISSADDASEPELPEATSPQQPEVASETGSEQGARPWPKGKRRRRRGGRGRGGRSRNQMQPAASAGEMRDSHPVQEPAFSDTEPGPELAEVRAPEHRPSEFDRQAQVPTAAVPISKATKGVVVLAIGLPGSGKSTWFKRHSVVPLSSDLLRTILFDDVTQQKYQDLVFSTLRALLRARLIARMPWNYVDATNLSPNERRGWIKMARDFGYEVHALFFDVPVEVCLERNRRRERVVPEDAMQKLAAKLRPPTFDEGFSKITVVRVKQKPE